MPADKPVLQRRLGVVQQLLQDGEYGEALQSALQLQERYPAALGPLSLAARASIELGDLSCAREHAGRAIRLRPRNVEVRLLYAQILIRSAQPNEAFALVRELEESAAHRAGALRRIARFHDRFGHKRDAYRAVLKAMEIEPEDVGTVYRTALLARGLGHQREARALCQRLYALDPDHASASLLRATLNPARPGEHHLEGLGFLLKTHTAKGDHRAALCQALGRELEDLEQFEPAFVSYEEATRLAQNETGFSDLLDSSSVNSVETAYAPLCRPAQDDEADSDAQPVTSRHLFLLGLPCSGFTEFGRWLSIQPEVDSHGGADPLRWLIDQRARAGAGELQAVDETAVGGFTRSLERLHGVLAQPEKIWLLHDAPGHYFHFGLLRRAMPHARFVHLRRDPLDQCLDLFSPEPGAPRLPLKSMDSLAEHFTAYHRLMGFWRRNFPGAMLEVDYEQFLAAPEQIWETIIPFLGLDPSSKAVAFEPLTERPEELSGRSRRFTALLETLARRLRANGVPVD